MGRLRYEDLQPSDNPRPPAEALLGSQLVGGRPMTDLTSAIMLVRNEQGELVFGVEIPIQAVSRRRIIKMRGGRKLSWVRLEFKAAKDEGIGRGHFLIVSEHPRSSLWWHAARFRPTSKKGRDERRDDDPENWAIDDRDEIIERLESLAYDPWETDPRYLTAGISRPGPGMGLHRTPEHKVITYQVYGVSSLQPRDLIDELARGKQAKHLLAMTRNRTISFWPAAAARVKRPRLLDETIYEANALMLCAIQQALAGPHSNSQTWQNRPVMDLAGRIFREHLYNTNRRNLRALR